MEEGADNLVSPVLVDAVAVVPEWWVFVALFAAAALSWALFVVLAFMIWILILQFRKRNFFNFNFIVSGFILHTTGRSRSRSIDSMNPRLTVHFNLRKDDGWS